jgi:hypothetical protein
MLPDILKAIHAIAIAVAAAVLIGAVGRWEPNPGPHPCCRCSSDHAQIAALMARGYAVQQYANVICCCSPILAFAVLSELACCRSWARDALAGSGD